MQVQDIILHVLEIKNNDGRFHPNISHAHFATNPNLKNHWHDMKLGKKNMEDDGVMTYYLAQKSVKSSLQVKNLDLEEF